MANAQLGFLSEATGRVWALVCAFEGLQRCLKQHSVPRNQPAKDGRGSLRWLHSEGYRKGVWTWVAAGSMLRDEHQGTKVLTCANPHGLGTRSSLASG